MSSLDASLANIRDYSSQLGYIIFASDRNNNVITPSFKSYKVQRITISAMSAEVISFGGMNDAAITTDIELQTPLKQHVPF